MKRHSNGSARWRRAGALAVLVLLQGCAVHREWTLYPVNSSTASNQILEARRTDHIVAMPYVGSATIGTIEIIMPDGEVLQGRYDSDGGGGPGYGSIFEAVYGPQGASHKSAVHKGYATLLGNRSTSMQCEFYTLTFSGRIKGACRSSAGSLYRFEQ